MHKNIQFTLKIIIILLGFNIQNNDTILELGQDRIDVDYPLDFLFNQFDTVNGKAEKRFVRIGKILLRDDEFFIFDTRDSIGKNFYQGLSIVPVDNIIEEFSIFNYPYLPIAKIYSLKEGKLNLMKDRDIYQI